MENTLDMVADGKMEWKQVLRDFYPLLAELLAEAEAKVEKR